MRRTKCAVWTTLTFLVIASVARGATAQIDSQAAGTETPSAAPVIGHPFSAIKYLRTVKVSPDGKPLIKTEHHKIQLARDTDGRVRMVGVDISAECVRPELPVPPPCPYWSVVMFDPVARNITHWPKGTLAAHAAVVVTLSAAQIEAAEASTSTLPENTAASAPDVSNVTTRNIGEKVVEGVRAIGVRTTTVHPADYSSNKKPFATIHEVWTSMEMKLVVKIVDGNPHGEEIIAGLEHVSLAPDPALFQPPPGYAVQSREESALADEDLLQLAEWFVK